MRICGVCKKEITEGFCIGDGDEYFCSEECLNKCYSDKEYNRMYDDGLAYWTTWEDED